MGVENYYQESEESNSSYRSSTVEDLSSVLDQISLKDKQPETKPKESILNIRKRFVKKSTVVDVESDSESESFASLGTPASSPSVDYTSAEDGDVDSPVISKVKSKIKVAVLPKPLSSLHSQTHQLSEADDDQEFAAGTKSRARGNVTTSSSAWFETISVDCITLKVCCLIFCECHKV